MNWYKRNISDTWIEYVLIALGLIGAILAAIIILMVIVFPIGAIECSVRAQSFNHYYDVFGGCMVEIQGVWLHINQVGQFLIK